RKQQGKPFQFFSAYLAYSAVQSLRRLSPYPVLRRQRANWDIAWQSATPPNSVFATAACSATLRRVSQMALHPNFPTSPYAPLIPEQRWFPVGEAMRATAYEKLLPPLVAKVRKEVFAWRNGGYAGASATSRALLRWWFDTEQLVENADGNLSLLLCPTRGGRVGHLAA